jgi:mechanosensitive ion channel-like protein
MFASVFTLADLVSEILRAFGDAISVLFAFIPALIGALIILLIGWIVGRVVAAIVRRLLHAAHFDQAMERAGIGAYLQRGGLRTSAVDILASLVFWFIFLIFVLAAADALHIPAISNIVNAIVLWLPQLFVALLVLIIGALLARLVGEVVRRAMDGAGVSGGPILASVAAVAVFAFAAIIALNQIGVGSAIVQVLFASVMFGLALALALAFGLGGRDTAKNIVDSWYATTRSRRAVMPREDGQVGPTSPHRAPRDVPTAPPA